MRLERGLTQAQLAVNLGLKSQSTVAMWENESRKPPSTILPRLAAELGCTVNELYTHAPPGRDSA
ncbi:helix-turn-helix transcriptional regulator [uncultured Oscillibacter sp.]|uniref:helix-turn-helix transcriptional regulator n=1 Tax=uncultured Oscillibacter sp. TaxID=876091 RepID=UPI00343CDD7C